MYDVIYCAGLERIEDAGGGNLRFCLFELRDGAHEIVAEIVAPTSAVPDAVMKMLAALSLAKSGFAKAFALLDLRLQ